MPILKPFSWYGFDHKAVAEKFEGDLLFCAEFCVNGEYDPVAVYKAKKPSKKKGHKKYMLLQLAPSGIVQYPEKTGIIRGMTQKEINKFRYQEAIHCLNCDLVLYSINRHHYHGCGCEKEVTIDGGNSYTKIGYKPDSKYQLCKIDLLTQEVFCEIPLTQNKTAKVDLEDYQYLNQFSWRANYKGGWYALRSVNRKGEHKTFKMHREILKLSDPKIFVDHKNGNGLDNRRQNLRICTNSQNQANQKPVKRNTTGYRGVQKLPENYKTKRYKAVILVKGKQRFLGNYKTKEEAAKAYNKAAAEFFGEFAKLNKIA